MRVHQRLRYPGHSQAGDDRKDYEAQNIIENRYINEDKKFEIVFEDVYKAYLDMNFGVVAQESIRFLIVENSDEAIKGIIEKWKSINSDLNSLRCFHLNTNSTNSDLRIYALRYLIREV